MVSPVELDLFWRWILRRRCVLDGLCLLAIVLVDVDLALFEFVLQRRYQPRALDR